MVVAPCDIQLPVCLSVLGVLNYMNQGIAKRALCFLAIIPETGKTQIIFGAAIEHKEAVWLQFKDQSSPAILEMLESWMIYGGDHWFITPSAWSAVPPNRRRAIRDHIFKPWSLVFVTHE